MEIKEILRGWGNVFVPSKALLPEFKRRFEVCNGCQVRTGIYCDKNKGGCGCIIIAKTRSESKCPLDKW